MSISLVAAVTSFTNPAFPAGDQWTFAIPSGALAGDVVLLIVGSTVNVSSGCHVTTASWNTALLWRGDDSDMVIAAAYTLTGSESSPLTVTFTDDLDTSQAIPVALVYRGALLPASASGASAFATPPTYTSPSQTPTARGDWYIGIAHVNTNASPIDSTPGTQRFNVAAHDDTLAVFDIEAALAAPFGPQMSISSTGPEGSAHSLLLVAAPSATLAGGVADLALVVTGDVLPADLASDGTDLAFDAGLRTAVALSLFTDRRAFADDAIPSGDPRDRRGWWADKFAEIEGDLYGSRLWLLDRSTRTGETTRRAKEYALEALAWMLEDRVVSAIDVTVATTEHDLQITVTLTRPGRDPVAFRFAHVWDAIAA